MVSGISYRLSHWARSSWGRMADRCRDVGDSRHGDFGFDVFVGELGLKLSTLVELPRPPFHSTLYSLDEAVLPNLPTFNPNLLCS